MLEPSRADVSVIRAPLCGKRVLGRLAPSWAVLAACFGALELAALGLCHLKDGYRTTVSIVRCHLQVMNLMLELELELELGVELAQ